MSLLWYSGFEWQSITAGVEWSNSFGTPAISTAIKNTGSASLRVQTPTIFTPKGMSHVWSGSDANVIYAQFYMRIDMSVDVETSCFALYDASGGRMSVSLHLTADDKIGLWYNDTATQVGSNSSALSKNTQYRIEVKLDRSGAGGTHVLEARIDGAAAFASTSSATVSWGANQVGVGLELNGDGAAAGDVYFDDLVLRNDAYPGGERVVISVPTGSGDSAATTGNASMVNEVPPSNTATSGSTMAELDSNGVTASYNMTDSSTLGIDSYDTISAVMPLCRIREESAGTSSYRHGIKSASGGTTTLTTAADGGNTTVRTCPNGTTAFGRMLISETDPTTGVAWTPTGTNSIDNMQQVVANVDADSTPDLWVLTMGTMILYKDGVAPGGSVVKDVIGIGILPFAR